VKRITVIASGTRGDVQPAIALGVALRAAGYAVRLVASQSARDWIERHGLDAAPSAVDMEAVMAGPFGRAWVEQGHNQLKQQGLMRRLLEEHGAQLIRDAWEGARDADAVIGAFTSDPYAVTIGEKLDIPVLSMPLQPTLIATRDGRCMTSAPLPTRVSRLNALFGRFILEPFPWRLYGTLVNDFRREIGLAPQSSGENVAARRRMTVLHAISRHVMAIPDDWPASFHVTGYWFLGEGEAWQPPDDLAAFLADGPPPIGIGFGSMTAGDPEGTTRLLLEATEAAGQRAILLGGWAGLGTMDLPPGVHSLPSAPHDWLFPRLAAVVHHGGAGTTAAGFAAGIPAVVVPHMADQPYWGRKVAALGVGPRPVPRHRLTSERLASAIRTAVTDPEMRARAAALGARVRAEDGTGVALGIIRDVVRP
jgi:UDP:flavonoid glycosyltransferase YjiC (YdhE family)